MLLHNGLVNKYRQPELAARKTVLNFLKVSCSLLRASIMADWPTPFGFAILLISQDLRVMEKKHNTTDRWIDR